MEKSETKVIASIRKSMGQNISKGNNQRSKENIQQEFLMSQLDVKTIFVTLAILSTTNLNE